MLVVPDAVLAADVLFLHPEAYRPQSPNPDKTGQALGPPSPPAQVQGPPPPPDQLGERDRILLYGTEGEKEAYAMRTFGQRDTTISAPSTADSEASTYTIRAPLPGECAGDPPNKPAPLVAWENRNKVMFGSADMTNIRKGQPKAPIWGPASGPTYDPRTSAPPLFRYYNSLDKILVYEWAPPPGASPNWGQ